MLGGSAEYEVMRDDDGGHSAHRQTDRQTDSQK